MQFGRRQFALLVALSLLGFTVSVQLALAKKREKQNSAVAQMDERKRALHALNRLTFGSRPGDVERVMAMGVDKWIDQQLHPEKIDDHALEARLTPFRTLRMDTRQIVENFPPPQLIKAAAEGKRSLPSDPAKRAVYEAQIERMQERQERKQEAANPDPTADPTGKGKLSEEDRARRREDRLYADLKGQELLDMPPDQRIKEILKMSPGDQRALATSLKGDKRDEIMEGMNPQQRETLMALNNPQQVVVEELVENKLLRAVYSERQFQEVMTDFWFNHFNVFLGKGADRYLLTSYERDVIRPHTMGKFEDLLVATAQSPAMLFYLDNWLSVGPNSDFANGIPKRRNNRNWRRRERNRVPVKQAKSGRGGLNENYGRELMELHTLGVDGGYTQKDVTEVARIFTGWPLKQPKQGGGFTFEDRMHEPGDKMVLGHRIKSKGEKEGLEMLHLLAHHPSTAKFVCTKLAVRFVSDNPPPVLVDRMAQTFLKKNGEIREVLKTMLDSPEFWAADAYRAKVKTPLEFVVSAVRGSGAEVTDAMPLARQLQIMGMPLYGMQPPTGYSMKADAWVNSAALLARMNFTLALTAGKLKGVQADPDRMLGAISPPADPQQTLAVLENSLLAGSVSMQTHDTIAAQLQDPKISQRRLDDPARPPNVSAIAGLLLGSPEFQRR
ncbi:MAG: hypothetical protein AUH86_20110 [Acidobacteria bacterium 13_1_40CM_4_58_4]|nr:MAG: hypothetical protein AUH86_20110 [Acidobacteria bacterium 13_1_40CM_4_58_4]